MIFSGKICFLLFYIGECETNTRKIIDHREVSGVSLATEQLGGKHAVLALFSFLKGYGKALFVAQYLLRKSYLIDCLRIFHSWGHWT